MPLKTFSGRKPSQMEGELSALIALFKAERVRTYLEVGAREGDTFFDIVSSLPYGSRAVAVDLPGGMWGKFTTGLKLSRACDALVAKGYDVSYILADSTNPAIIAEVARQAPFDAIMIDGDHRYEGVLQDWTNYGPMGSLVAFHDIVGYDECEKVHGHPVEVPRLWAEIKAGGARTMEFIDEGSAMGIGVVRTVGGAA